MNKYIVIAALAAVCIVVFGYAGLKGWGDSPYEVGMSRLAEIAADVPRYQEFEELTLEWASDNSCEQAMAAANGDTEALLYCFLKRCEEVEGETLKSCEAAIQRIACGPKPKASNAKSFRVMENWEHRAFLASDQVILSLMLRR